MARKKTAPELEAILERIPEDKKYIGRKLIDELVFMQDAEKENQRERHRGRIYTGETELCTGKHSP